MNTGRDRDESIERLLHRKLSGGDAAPGGALGECPDAETLAAWADRGLGEHEMAFVEAHASECGRCQALLAAVGQTAPDASAPAWQETWLRGWGLRWLVPVAATAAAAVILWVTVPNGERPDLPEQARAQLPAPAPPPPEARADRFDAPAAAPPEPATAPREQAGAANEKKAVETADKAPSFGGPERGLRKENADSATQPTESVDTLSASARAAPPAAGASQSQSALSETVTVTGRQAAAQAAPVEITSPDPSVRWRIRGGRSVEHTTNGGTTWEAVPTGADVDITAGTSPSPSVCWLVGRSGAVLLTTDGRTWRRVAFPENTDLAAVQAVDARTATVTTAGNRTFRTTDGGLTWN